VVSVPILVTDGEQRAALAVVRSLGRAGHAVFVCSTRRRSLAGASRYCSGEELVPDALGDEGDYIAAVKRLVGKWGIGLVLPVSEASLLALLPARAQLDGVRIPFPSADVFQRICNKAFVLSEARAAGIRVPDEHRLETPEDRANLATAALHFPLVLKPARSVSNGNNGRVKWPVTHVRDWSSLQVALDHLGRTAYPVLLQQRIVGPGIGVFLLVWQGEVVARFAHRRLREKPVSGGVSVLSQSIPPDDHLVALSHALLQRLGWEGVAMCEYKLAAATATPYLMEINARFWGSLQLAIDAGVDFPALLVSAALGQHPEPVRTYRIGLKSRWWWGDVDHLLARLRRSRDELALPPGAPGRWHAIADFLTSWGSARSDVLRLDDGMPFVRETLDWIRGR